MSDSIEFVTVVRIRPGSGSPARQRQEVRSTDWQNIRDIMDRLGVTLKTLEDGQAMIYNVLGNDYDLMILGTTANPKNLMRVDAVLKAQGYESRTHPAVQAEEYSRLAEESEQVLSGNFGRARA